MITPIPLKYSNAYLIKQKKPILVDTGGSTETYSIMHQIRLAGVEPNDLSLIIHTHGHFDHCGSTYELKELLPHVPTVIHELDAFMMREGINSILKPRGILGRLITPFSTLVPYKGTEADMLINEEGRLTDYGIDGRIVFTPGHTPGSISVLLDNGDVIAGDLLSGGYLFSKILNKRPMYPLFVEDLEALHDSIRKLIDLGARKFYVGHGGPLKVKDIEKYFATIF